MSNLPRVRDRLQQAYGLRVLQLRMDSASGEGKAVFNLTLGRDEDVAILTSPIEDIGLPPTSRLGIEGEAGLEESRFSIPERILITLKVLLGEGERRYEPLWIRLSAPRGLLTAVPWERLLQPALGIPVFRLPQHLICPHAPPAGLDFVICLGSSASTRDDQVTWCHDLIRHMPASLEQAVTYHVFAEEAVRQSLEARRMQFGTGHRINTYKWPDKPVEAEVSPTHHGENCWLLWMKEVLGSRTADNIHFLCDGYRIRDEGALILAEPDSGKRNLIAGRLVFSCELVDFLEEIGTWSVTFTSTPAESSAAGIRMLHDRVAQQRPGPTIFHDMDYPGNLDALRDAYEFLYMPPARPPDSGALSIYCHPLWTTGAPADVESLRQLQQYTLDGKVGNLLTSKSPPVWLASAQRKFEATAGDLAEAETEDPNNGRKQAREFLLNVIADHLQRSGDTEGGKK